MEIFDLGLAWDREFDSEFIQALNNIALKEGLRPYLLHAYNFYTSLKDISGGSVSFKYFLGRFSDDDSTFKGLTDFLKKKDVIFINHPDKIKMVKDKAIMHGEFTKQKIPHSSEKKILYKNLGKRPALFRVFYACGNITPCWFNPDTHIYDMLSLKEIYTFGLFELWFITKTVHKICGLNFFSVEVAWDGWRNFIVVDMVNYSCDMRRKSKFDDGVPDEIVNKAIANIISFVKTKS